MRKSLPASLRLWAGVRLAVALAAITTFSYAADKGELAAAPAPRNMEPTYSIQVGLDGEIFPVFAHQAALQKPTARTWGTVAVKVTNSSDTPLRQRITVHVPGWSDQEIQSAEMSAGEVHTYLFAPAFFPRLYQNRELTSATVVVEVRDKGGRVAFSQATPVRLRAADDMLWGKDFKFAPFIASWVTPHDEVVEQVLTEAKELMPGRRLPGYEEWKSSGDQEKSTFNQAKAIYRALQKLGVSYVKSSTNFGSIEMTQRIRMPHESLKQASANCIDGAVMYASMFENLGLDAQIVLIPGHAYVGVRSSQNGSKYLYFDTVLTGRDDFEASVHAAEKGLSERPANEINRIDVDESRRAGIFPMQEGVPIIRAMGTTSAARLK
jgi:hypothetical protein